MSNTAIRGAQSAAAKGLKQAFIPPPVAYYANEREEHYWKKIPRWQDVTVDKFLSHKWQVSTPRHETPAHTAQS